MFGEDGLSNESVLSAQPSSAGGVDSAHTLTDLDRKLLDVALRLGAQNQGRTAPNPSVGALVVQFDDDGRSKIVGRGVTAVSGRPHAEVVALQEAGALAKGATCYVSLEPCSHYGKTPPCVEALVESGIARVVVGVRDPDNRVSGLGYKYLRDNGVIVFQDIAMLESMSLHQGHFSRIQSGRPAVSVKLAVSKDGMIGRTGEGFVEITGEQARRAGHALRAQTDAIMVGVGTVLADDPDLTCRLHGMEDWSPVRVVLDADARTPVNAKLFDKVTRVPVRVYVSENADQGRVEALRSAGANVVVSDLDPNGRLDLLFVLSDLHKVDVTNLLVEGGAKLANSFLNANLVDRFYFFEGAGEVGEAGVPALPNSERLGDRLGEVGLMPGTITRWGDDVLQVWTNPSMGIG